MVKLIRVTIANAWIENTIAWSLEHQFYIDGIFQFAWSQTMASAIQPQLLGTLFSSKEQEYHSSHFISYNHAHMGNHTSLCIGGQLVTYWIWPAEHIFGNLQILLARSAPSKSYLQKPISHHSCTCSKATVNTNKYGPVICHIKRWTTKTIVFQKKL